MEITENAKKYLEKMGTEFLNNKGFPENGHPNGEV